MIRSQAGFPLTLGLANTRWQQCAALGALSSRNQPAFLFEFVFLDLTAGVTLI